MKVEETPLFCVISDNLKEPLKAFEEYLSTRLSKIMLYFGDYTDHGIGHAWRTLNAFCEVIQNRGIVDEFNGELALIGICSCLIHDIGMGPITPEELRESSSPGWVLKDSTRRESIRNNHHERTATWILHSNEAKDKLGWFPESLLPALANVALAHRGIDIPSNEILGENSDFAFIAALLRLADQIDLSEDRVTHLGLSREDMPLDDETQTLEMLKSLADAKFYLEDNTDQMILKSQQPVDNVTLKTLEALNLLVEDIEETLVQTRDILWRNREVLPRQLTYEFHVTGEDSSNHALRADFKQVWFYLSKSLYEGANLSSISLREALTNAIDACRLRKAIDPDAACTIDIEHNGNEIIIADNGVGMSSRVIEKHLKVLGSSYYSSPWFLKNPSNSDIERHPMIGEYGIGVFSYSLMTDEFEILTAIENAAPRRILFSRIFGVTLGPLVDEPLGPRTVLKLKQPKTEIGTWPSSKSLLSNICYWFPRCDIPMYYTFDGTRSKIRNLETVYNHHIEINDEMVTIEFSDSYECQDATSGLRLELGMELQQRYYSNSKQMAPKSSDALLQFYKSRDHQTAFTHKWEQSIVMFRGLNLDSEKIELGIFGNALTKFLITPFWFRAVSFGWTDSASKKFEGYNSRFRYWCNIDDIHNRPNLTKSQFRNRERAKSVLNKVSKKLENLFAKHVATILDNEEIHWSLREVLRAGVLREMSLYGLGSYDNPDRIFPALLEKMPCYDVISHEIMNFEEILKMPRDTKICFAPFSRWLHSAENYGVISYAILSPIRMLRTRSRVKTEAERVAKKIRGKLKYGGDYRIIFVFCGDVDKRGSLKSLKLVMSKLNFENVIFFEENPYSDYSRDIWLDESLI